MTVREHILFKHGIPQADVLGMNFRDVATMHDDLHVAAGADSNHRREYQGWTHDDVKAAGVEVGELENLGITTKVEVPETLTERVDAAMLGYVPDGAQRIQFDVPTTENRDHTDAISLAFPSDIQAAHGPHGEHYAAMGLQPIDVIEAWGLNFNLGSVVKYLARPKGQTIEDLEKAVWYLQRELENRRTAAL